MTLVTGCAAAVTFIPVAGAVVVTVVTPTVAYPIFGFTASFVTGTLASLLEFRVHALALAAIAPLALVAG